MLKSISPAVRRLMLSLLAIGALAMLQLPATAAPFANSLTDPDQRNEAIKGVAQAWLRLDPAAATTWLQSTSLPQDQIQQLLTNPQGDDTVNPSAAPAPPPPIPVRPPMVY